MALLSSSVLLLLAAMVAHVRAAPTTATRSSTLASQAESLFEGFKADFGRVYADQAEEDMRFEAFTASMEQADELNQMAMEDGLDTEFGVTKFSDLTPEEFSVMLGFRKSNETLEALDMSFLQGTSAPSSKSWVGTATTAVKDQGKCGSCWAFSATEQIESMWMLSGSGKKPYELSVQQIISCDKGQDEGCNGGDTSTAYKYVKRAGGLEDGADYPSTSSKTGRTGQCEFEKRDIVVDITKGSTVGKGDEDTMMKYVGSTAPLSICVDATKWQNYKNGLFGPRMCGGKQLDHCVQIVGYDTESKSYPYWVVRNSWNTDWGMDGFIQLVEGYDTCGLTQEPSTVTISQ